MPFKTWAEQGTPRAGVYSSTARPDSGRTRQEARGGRGEEHFCLSRTLRFWPEDRLMPTTNVKTPTYDTRKTFLGVFPRPLAPSQRPVGELHILLMAIARRKSGNPATQLAMSYGRCTPPCPPPRSVLPIFFPQTSQSWVSVGNRSPLEAR